MRISDRTTKPGCADPSCANCAEPEAPRRKQCKEIKGEAGGRKRTKENRRGDVAQKLQRTPSAKAKMRSPQGSETARPRRPKHGRSRKWSTRRAGVKGRSGQQPRRTTRWKVREEEGTNEPKKDEDWKSGNASMDPTGNDESRMSVGKQEARNTPNRGRAGWRAEKKARQAGHREKPRRQR